MFYLGIDVSKAKLDCLLLNTTTDKRKSKTVVNSAAGYTALLSWLSKQGAMTVHIILEPTGVYHERAVLALTDAGLTVSLVNPAQVRRFAQGIGIRSKTDAADSFVLARYGATQKPAAWQPPSLSVRQLQALLTRRDALAEDLQREENRAEKMGISELPELVQTSLELSIKRLKEDLKALQRAIDQHIDNDPDLRCKRELLETIPGVGERVSTQMTALLGSRDFTSSGQLASYLGLVPVQWQSGTSVRGRSRLSKAGPSHLRKLLYMPAVVCTSSNPTIKALYERLLKQGKCKMAALGAAMRKLACLCFGVVHSNKPYDPNWLTSA